MSITLNITFDNITDLQTFLGRNAPTPAVAVSAPTPTVFAPEENYAAPAQLDTVRQIFDADTLPEVGVAVHWKGQRYEFDGVVETISTDNTDDEDKAVFIRRGDTGKLVSLTYGDLGNPDNMLVSI